MGLRQADTAPIPEAARKEATKKRVEEAALIKPSRGEIARESIPVAQNVALVGGGTVSALEPDDDLMTGSL